MNRPLHSIDRHPAWAEAGFLLALAVIVLAIYVWLMQLWQATWSVPLEYSLLGDHWMAYFWTKSLFDFGSVYTNPLLNFPSGYVAYDFPISEQLQLTMLRACCALSGSYGGAINLYTVLNYPLIAIAAAAVFRIMGMRRGTTLVCATLYTFLPYHFFRQQLHVYISTYFFVPPTVLMLWWLARGVPMAGPGWRLTRCGWAAVAIAMVSGFCGVYHVAFTAGFLFFVLLLRLVTRGSWRSVIAPALLGALMLCSCLITLWPTIQFHLQYGPNQDVAHRDPSMADTYGLRLTELVLPHIHHRLQFLADLHKLYGHQFDVWNEGVYSTLGVVGVFGLGLLCLHLLRSVMRRPHDRRLALAMLFVAAALAVASAGTLGSLFALFVTPAIRSMNRVSLFIAFFCLLAVGLRLDRWLSTRSMRGPKAKLVLAGVLAIGLFDQSSSYWTPDYAKFLAQWNSDDQMIRRIEQTVGPDAAIFNLPVIDMPEGVKGNYTASQGTMGYLHSSTLHWSHGFFLGRGTDSIERDVLSRPPDQAPPLLREKGFSGILIDKRGFANDAVISQLAAAGSGTFTSDDQQLIFIDLRRPASTRPSP